MDATQMNTRIDAALKGRGDATLEAHGRTPSDAVRSLWRFLAEERTLPDFMQGGLREAEAPHDMAQVAREGAGLALRMAAPDQRSLGLEGVSFDDLRMLSYEEELRERAEGYA